jgi:hypothetical protein
MSADLMEVPLPLTHRDCCCSSADVKSLAYKYKGLVSFLMVGDLIPRLLALRPNDSNINWSPTGTEFPSPIPQAKGAKSRTTSRL